MKPLTYDFPHRMRGPASGERELTRLERSIGVAALRGDKATVDYLTRRHQRAKSAYRALCSRLRITSGVLPAEPSTSDPLATSTGATTAESNAGWVTADGDCG